MGNPDSTPTHLVSEVRGLHTEYFLYLWTRDYENVLVIGRN